MSARGLAKVMVLGSVHMDLIANADRLPMAGESVAGGSFAMAPGGKAGNQAIQLARCGVRTQLIARLGRDDFGEKLLRGLRAAGVDVGHVSIDEHVATGASVVMASRGEYASIIAPGAAAELTPDDIDRALIDLRTADALVLQLELPVAITEYAATRAREAGVAVILNASPIAAGQGDISQKLWRCVTTVIANGGEAARLHGDDKPPADAASAKRLAARLREHLHVSTMVVTIGANGLAAATPDGVLHQPAFPAAVVGTVGAGDALLGAMTAAMVQNCGLEEALRRGAAAGALAAERRGAYDALPTAAAIDALLARYPDEAVSARSDAQDGGETWPVA